MKGFLQCKEFFNPHDAGKGSGRDSLHVSFQNLFFFCAGWITERNTHEKTIQLCFWKRKCPCQFGWILRSKDHERCRQRIGDAVDTDLALLHGFQKGGLCLGAGTIDLVCQNNLMHDAARMDFFFAGCHVKECVSCHVSRHDIRSKLNASKTAAQRTSQGRDQSCLP